MRFTIRELILLTTIICVSLGWWLERQARAAVVAEAKTALADARSLAFLASLHWPPKGGFTVRAIDYYHKLLVKYEAPSWPRLNVQVSSTSNEAESAVSSIPTTE